MHSQLPYLAIAVLVAAIQACGGPSSPQAADGGLADAAITDTGKVAADVLDAVDQASADDTQTIANKTADEFVGQDAAPATLDSATIGLDVPTGPDANGAACTGNEPPGTWNDKYVCASCTADNGYTLACVAGTLACPSFAPAGALLLSYSDWTNHTGPCASAADKFAPGFSLWDPWGLQTNRDPAAPLVLYAQQSVAWLTPKFAPFFDNPTAAEKAVHALVVLTDMKSGQSMDYGIGAPQVVSEKGSEGLNLTPTSLLAGGWYRVTMHPGNSQTFVKAIVYGNDHVALTKPVSIDFYTYSRPMIRTVLVAYKGSKGYIEFSFTESMVSKDFAGGAGIQVAVDKQVLTGCLIQFGPCAVNLLQETINTIRLDLATVPKGFKDIELRIPAMIPSVNGGKLLDGVKGNDNAVLDGDVAVYTFHASDMVAKDGGQTLYWHPPSK